MYGGRVIDSYDQRIVNTFMEEYFGEFVVENFHPFYFYRDQNVHYSLPAVGTKEDYLSKIKIRYYFLRLKTTITIIIIIIIIILDAIEELPLINVPGVIGLHPNAEMGYFTKASKDIWNNLLKFQPLIGKS